ncbi:MAG: YciI family protein [Planctomycetota bacterium]|nr:YciI family protein [Planctomycetota bacterium]
MRYLLLINGDETRYPKLSEAETDQLMAAYDDYTESLKAAGAFIASDRLQFTSAATTVRVRDGKTMTTDGPFAETKEQLGGYYHIEAKDLDEAIAWAAKIPTAHYGCVEVRPVWG